VKLLDYTSEAGFLPRQECRDLEDAVSRLVAALASEGAVEQPERLVAEVMRREEEASTILGRGLAIPHARFETVRRLRLAVASLARPVTGTDEDATAVDVVILIVSPRGDPRHMLRILARLARLVKQGGFLDDLRAAGSAADMRRVLADAEASRV
jgi:mannitol/fructose-specific phosphotransferase system IIA component (Ntr-type)